MNSTASIARQEIRIVTEEHILAADDQLAMEEPLEISLAFREAEKWVRKSISVTMRTPGNYPELAIGFLFTEGIIRNSADIRDVKSDVLDENQVLVTLADAVHPDLNTLERNFYTTSSCGVCGKASIDAIKTVSAYAGLDTEVVFDKSIFFTLNAQIQQQQSIFESTGGLHASALFDKNGTFITLREDVGRHNALDKLIGNAVQENKLPLRDHILLLSGRASFELIQKASMAGIRMVAAIGAPSSLAVQLAAESNMTLVGFLKNNRYNIYTGFDRIKDL